MAWNICVLCDGSVSRMANRSPRFPPSTRRSDLVPPVHPELTMPGRVLPFGEFVLKVHSRCDLACDHCYVYEHADQSWRRRPAAIPQETVAKAAERIAEHARDHRLSDVRVILHGGEPLLVGLDGLARITRTLRAAIEPVCR